MDSMIIVDWAWLGDHKNVKRYRDEATGITLWGHFNYHPITGVKLCWVDKNEEDEKL